MRGVALLGQCLSAGFMGLRGGTAKKKCRGVKCSSEGGGDWGGGQKVGRGWGDSGFEKGGAVVEVMMNHEDDDDDPTDERDDDDDRM